MFFNTPSSKEHTMKRIATTAVAVVLVALVMSAVASAKSSPAKFSAARAPQHRSAKLHATHAAAAKPAYKLARFSHHAAV